MGVEGSWDKDASEARNRLGREEKQSVQGQIAIKGTRHGLLLTLEPETSFGDLLNALSERLAEAPDFFRGATLTVDTRQRALHTSERTELEHLLALYRMTINSMEQALKARQDVSTGSLGALDPPVPSPQGLPAVTIDLGQATQRDPRETDETLFLRRTIRSGQAIHHHSNIVVLGDVNPGAEVVSGGDIIVWGVLRGMVHAGYPDNEEALVCSLLLAPVQLRIAHLLSRPPEGLDVQPRPEVASIRQGQIVVETWLNGRPPRK